MMKILSFGKERAFPQYTLMARDRSTTLKGRVKV